MPDLRQKIVALIEANGPLSVAEYMAMCLYDPDDGYYTTREPFGAAGDFTTAPEISQMFGELVAVWLLTAWRAIGAPQPVMLAEIGPGRGTMMKDMLRAFSRLDAAFFAAVRIAMIETSQRLAGVQQETLGPMASSIVWSRSIDDLPRGPLLIVGNELFDAIPIRQYVKTGSRWQERVVGLDEAGALAFMAGAGALDPAWLPPGASDVPDGAIVELAPAQAALMTRLAARIATDGGVAMFFDYGYLEPAVGDSLQALSNHAFVDPLVEPGKADLTAHVDFAALANEAKAQGLDAHLMTQGDFLLGTGLLQRAGQLGAKADQTVRKRLQDEAERLAGPDGMGTLFKVLAVAPRGTVLPPFTRSD